MVMNTRIRQRGSPRFARLAAIWDELMVPDDETPVVMGRSDATLAVAGVALSAVLSWLFIGQESLWTDEANSIFFSRHWSQMWQQLLAHESNMWLYYVLLHFWLRLGDSEVIVRSLSALFAVTTVIILHALGRRMFGCRTATIVALLIAVNFFFIRYAQEARGYMLATCLVTLSSYCFVRAVEQRSLGLWLASGVCTALGVYTHFFAALICPAQLLSLAALGRRNIPWRAAGASVVVLAALLVPMALFQPMEGNQISWVQTPRLADIVGFYRLATGSWPLTVLYGLFATLAVLVTWPRLATAAHAPVHWRQVYAAAWATVPVLIAFVFSLVAKPVFVDRYLIVALPGLVLVGAAGIARLPRSWMRWAAVVLMLYLSSRCLNWWYRGGHKEDWRAVTSWVLSNGRSGDIAVVYWWTCKDAVEYYLDRADAKAPHVTVLDLTMEARRRDQTRFRLNAPLLASLPTTYDRVWILLRSNPKDPDRRAILQTMRAHYKCLSDRQFDEIRVLLFQRPA